MRSGSYARTGRFKMGEFGLLFGIARLDRSPGIRCYREIGNLYCVCRDMGSAQLLHAYKTWTHAYNRYAHSWTHLWLACCASFGVIFLLAPANTRPPNGCFKNLKQLYSVRTYALCVHTHPVRPASTHASSALRTRASECVRMRPNTKNTYSLLH